MLAAAAFPGISEPHRDDNTVSQLGDSALSVSWPSATSPLVLTTRGYRFTVRDEPPLARWDASGSRAFQGNGRFLAAVGAWKPTGTTTLATTRVEEYVVSMEASRVHRQRHAVTLPEGIVAVRVASTYLELLDANELPVLRFHDAVARDRDGTLRRATTRLGGARTVELLPESRGGTPEWSALLGDTLLIETELDLRGLVPPIVIDPGWSCTATMADARFGHAAVALPSGWVLVAGGFGGPSTMSLASAERYDPISRSWSAAAPLGTARTGPASVIFAVGPLAGQVLMFAGADFSGPTFGLLSAELYDPVADSWSPTGSLGAARAFSSATLLPSSGRVLAAGGFDYDSFATHATAELYDPATQIWTATGAMASARSSHAASPLSTTTDAVLVCGGLESVGGNDTLASAEVYDPLAGTWSPAPDMAEPRYCATATLLPTGDVLVAGGDRIGTGADPVSACELFDPLSMAWAPAAALIEPRSCHTATSLNTGEMLITGGDKDWFFTNPLGYLADTSELYDPVTDTWTPTGPLAQPRDGHSATLLLSGDVLVAGGQDPNTCCLDTTEVYSVLNTPAGSDVCVQVSEQVAVAFENVTVPGDTTVSLIEPPTACTEAFTLAVIGGCWEIQTTAVFTGKLAVCIRYDPDPAEPTFESTFEIVHVDGLGTPTSLGPPTAPLVDLTDPDGDGDGDVNDPVPDGGVICGETTSLSPFFVSSNVPPAAVASVAPLYGTTTGGSTVLVHGSGFLEVSAVSFGNTPAQSFRVETDELIAAVTPAHTAGWVDVAVTGALGTDTLASAFDFFVEPETFGVACAAPQLVWDPTSYPTLGQQLRTLTLGLGAGTQTMQIAIVGPGTGSGPALAPGLGTPPGGSPPLLGPSSGSLPNLSGQARHAPAPECLLFFVPSIIEPLGTADLFSLDLPSDPVLIGQHVLLQAIVRDGSETSTTNAIDVLIGP